MATVIVSRYDIIAARGASQSIFEAPPVTWLITPLARVKGLVRRTSFVATPTVGQIVSPCGRGVRFYRGFIFGKKSVIFGNKVPKQSWHVQYFNRPKLMISIASFLLKLLHL